MVDGPDSRWKIFNSFVDGGRNSWIGECPRDAGCMFVMRKVKDDGAEVVVSKRGRRKLVEEVIVEKRGRTKSVVKKGADEDDDEDDEDWEEQPEDDEPLEYASDLEDESLGETNDVEMEDAEDAEPDEAAREEYRRFCHRALLTVYESKFDSGHDSPVRPAWYSGHMLVERPDETQDDMYPIFYPGNDDASDHGTDGSMDSDDDGSPESRRTDHYLGGKLGYYPKQQYDVEHIAGPGCSNRCGYSGHRISVQEMRGCQVSQCLVRKPKGWIFEPLEDDEEFEKQGKFFLSGLSDHMPSRDSSSPRVKPARHGCEVPHAENMAWDASMIDDYAMPFHPSCFEIFKRASLREHGCIDIDGLTSWWMAVGKKCAFDDHCEDENVGKCQEQEWSHWEGTEYLVANPLFVPKLQDVLRQVTSTPPGFNPRNSAFPVPESTAPGDSTDLFARLPPEIKFEILDQLHSRDIAALRLATRTFRQLPVSYFQKLLNREMPWLWEAWPTFNKLEQLPYSFWATVGASEAEIKLRQPQKAIECLRDYVEMVSEDMPELQDMLEEALPAEIQAILDTQQLEAENDEDRKPFFLPPDGTNYYLLYTLIQRYWKDLKGLQNRRRIWGDCGGIVKRIRQMREDGEIGPLVHYS